MNIRKRLLSFIICGVMAFSACPLTAFADDSVYTGGLCEHHTEHNEECGYVPAKEGSPCGYWCEICAGETEESDKADATDETDETEEPECECDTLCTEDEVNEDCPVCSAEGAELDKVCVGAALLLTAPTLRTGEIKLFIGGQQITESGCYANQNGTWTKVDGTEPANGQFSYDADTVTLTLNQAEITHDKTVTVAEGYTYQGSVIAFSQTADVSLKIVVSQGRSTITGTGGIRVDSTTGNASLSIKGSGSLDVEPNGSNSGITIAGLKNVKLDIDGADVTASSPAQYGVYLISSTDASSTSTIAVNNGSLTTGGNGNVGIYYYWSGTSNAGTSSLTVSGNAVVDTRNSQIMDQNKETVVQVGAGSDGNGGIVFNGKNGTVYGDVELQENLEIGEDETLTIGKDASLTVPDEKTLTNNGTVTTEEGGTLTGNITNAPPKITTTTPLPDGTVGTVYNQQLAAENTPTQWSVTNGTLPDGLNLENDTISGTPTAASSSTFTITATNGNGSDSKEFTLSINEETKYSLTVNLNGGNGTTTGGQYTKGTEIRIDAGAKSGYRFASWTSSNGGSFADASSASTTFTMPANDTTITANWKKKSSGGSYSLPEGTDRDEPKDEPEEEPEVEPDTPGTDITTDFSDVPAEAWYSEAVDYVTENGIMSGVGGNRFEPEAELKREMLAVILWNMTDNPEPNGIAPFLDVTSDKYYAKAIAWANENGVMYGYGEEFGVGEAVTREDFAAILYRYAAFKGYDTTQGGMAIREFIDFEQIADYAVEALGWAVNSGIISGMGDGTVSPKTSTYRGQAAVMLMKFCENIMK